MRSKAAHNTVELCLVNFLVCGKGPIPANREIDRSRRHGQTNSQHDEKVDRHQNNEQIPRGHRNCLSVSAKTRSQWSSHQEQVDPGYSGLLALQWSATRSCRPCQFKETVVQVDIHCIACSGCVWQSNDQSSQPLVLLILSVLSKVMPGSQNVSWQSATHLTQRKGQQTVLQMMFLQVCGN